MNASAYTHDGESAQEMTLDPQRLALAAREAGLDSASLAILPIDPPGTAVEVAPGRELYPASMIKVPLVAAALFEVAGGRLGIDAPVRIEPANMTANDAASPFEPGYVATLAELMHHAIARSDNVATNVLFDAVGRERATEIARERFGLAATAFHRKLSGSDPLIEDPQWDGVHRNAHPAGDAARLFSLVARGEIPLAGRLRSMLAGQAWNEKLPRGLRPADRFEHKTGDTSEVTHDGGILVTAEGRVYVVVVYTSLASSDEHNARFAPFMRAVREDL